ncbi:hypothetical protein Y032_0632g871 [Ancylostoma ceylanicum]|uniref:Uncharacterized protein n=1 Tax=Ancylostoma ceylanicum TaxID=53326 RepID=A0A016WKA5_9BILA|nr:hypothetical protein Y032_0632g871 [Ancylostoma ceylanicum]
MPSRAKGTDSEIKYAHCENYLQRGPYYFQKSKNADLLIVKSEEPPLIAKTEGQSSAPGSAVEPTKPAADTKLGSAEKTS